MYIGNFDRLLKIETPQVTKNSFGEEEIMWIEFTKIYGEKTERITIGEKHQSNQKVYIESITFSTYFEEGVNTRMRIIDIDENKLYQIVGVREIGYKEGLQIIVEYKDNERF